MALTIGILIMDLAEIEVFGTLMRVGTTIGTARVLGLSQPAVSDRLKRMEARLGFALFLRQGNRLVPTAEAQELFTQTAPVFGAQKEIRDRIEAIRANQQRPVTVSTTPALVDGFLAPRLARAGYEGWTRALRLWIGEPVEDVRQGRADVGLQMALQPRADLVVETLCEIALVAVMQTSHPLARRAALTVADFEGQPLVGFDPDWSPMGAAIRKAFAQQGLAYRLACQVPFCATVCHMVGACGGVGIIDELTAKSPLATALAVRPISALPALPLRLFHRLDRPLRARTHEFLLALK